LADYQILVNGSERPRSKITGRDIPTGLVTDRKSFDATPVFFARVYCPICRSEHEWFAKEAWVCEAEPRPRRGALL
jgi:hypothetical protein